MTDFMDKIITDIEARDRLHLATINQILDKFDMALDEIFKDVPDRKSEAA